ncbi:hypothetical protein RND71_012507 [Anisodus tanguticus]|uniref:Tubby C-terminal domain-containing protein n=1 Tax=Anisodus tanguticus TaxID=243964 RepID=A0AAE1SES0_9SOLA|nr:hypothetical protein RND71_012507 [Anisodus tanguticus]
MKNFQLVASPENGVMAGPEHEKVILQFGKVGMNMFIAFQAFSICLFNLNSCFWLSVSLIRASFSHDKVCLDERFNSTFPYISILISKDHRCVHISC